MMLQCPLCSRNGFQRLTRHFSQVHGLTKQDVSERFPDLLLEAPLPTRSVKCSDCGVEIQGLSPRAAYAKCEACRLPDPNAGLMLAECLLCKTRARALYAHLKASHDMSLATYREMFPGASTERPESRMRTEEGRKKQSQAAKRRWSIPEEREAQSERLKVSAPWTGKTLRGSSCCHLLGGDWGDSRCV